MEYDNVSTTAAIKLLKGDEKPGDDTEEVVTTKEANKYQPVDAIKEVKMSLAVFSYFPQAMIPVKSPPEEPINDSLGEKKSETAIAKNPEA